MSAQPLREVEHPPLEVVDSTGKRLRIARQAKGLTQSDVAAQLHLSTAVVQALEQDDHDRLPGPVFERGYIRNYARLLGLDEDILLTSHRESHSEGAGPTPAESYGPVRKEIRSSHFAVRLVSWSIVLGLAALLGFWWQGHLSWNGGVTADAEAQSPAAQGLEPTPQPAPNAVTEQMPAPADTAPVQPAVPVIESVAEIPAPSTAINETEGDLDTAGAAASRSEPPAQTETPAPAAPEEPADATVAEAAPPPQVEFEFLGPCWVDIRDSSRKFKIFGEMRKGDRRVLEGTPPYSVILGNAPMVRVSVGGEPFDISAYARGSVARFNLDPSVVD